jgi:hypothetical protein
MPAHKRTLFTKVLVTYMTAGPRYAFESDRRLHTGMERWVYKADNDMVSQKASFAII